MPILAETYEGFEIRLHMIGSPPFNAMIRRVGSRLYETEDITADTEVDLRAAARAWVDTLLKSGADRLP